MRLISLKKSWPEGHRIVINPNYVVAFEPNDDGGTKIHLASVANGVPSPLAVIEPFDHVLREVSDGLKSDI